MKIASWNVNSLRVRLPHVLQWLEVQNPDLLALQETKLVDDEFPANEFAALGYQCAFSGQKTYNGVALLARDPLLDLVTDLPEFPDPQRRVLAATIGDTRVLNLYVVNGQSINSEKYGYKLDWLRSVSAFVAADLPRYRNYVILGDFNIAPDDRDVYDPAVWSGKILCSAPERDALNSLLQQGFADTFRLFEQPENTFSWWDYRAAGFRRNLGLRIDLILANKALADRCRASFVDKTPRKLERPSDHAPVVAEFDS